ncbi:hypothetical protein P7C71_g1212, partial [Lecanoromycetidae sp. Uapishka_2]
MQPGNWMRPSKGSNSYRGTTESSGQAAIPGLQYQIEDEVDWDADEICEEPVDQNMPDATQEKVQQESLNSMDHVTSSLPPIESKFKPTLMTGSELMAEIHRRANLSRAAEKAEASKKRGADDMEMGEEHPPRKLLRGSIGPMAAPVHRTSEHERYPFDSIENPKKSTNCAIQVGRTSQPAGSPFQALQGWNCKVSLDGGKFGKPSIGLSISINKGDKTDRIADAANHKRFWAVGWEPGVKVGNDWMIESMSWHFVGSQEGQAYPAALRRLNVEEHKENLNERLVYLRLTCNGHKTSQYKEPWSEGLDEDTRETFRTLYRPSGQYEINIWFINPFGSRRQLSNCCLGMFRDALVKRLPPLHQYKDSSGKPLLDFEYPTPIVEFCKGMYLRYEEMLEDKVANKAFRPRRFNLTRAPTWKTIKDFWDFRGVDFAPEASFATAERG